tara:strand:+ start:234 stop:362 length:129 start_codon:yes stop_codon:yes gene_type:complete
MGIVVAALLVVAGVVYILFAVISYTSETNRLNQELDELTIRI